MEVFLTFVRKNGKIMRVELFSANKNVSIEGHV